MRRISDSVLMFGKLPEKRDLVVFCPLAERQIVGYQNLIDSPGKSNGRNAMSAP